MFCGRVLYGRRSLEIWQTDHMIDLLSRLAAAAPSAVMVVVFLIAWIDPGFFGAPYIKNLMLVMLFEFVVMHSSVMCNAIVAMTTSPLAVRLSLLLGLTAFYSCFVLAFALAFHSWWPLWVFGYLFVCRFMYLVLPGDIERKLAGATKVWIASALAYLGGAFLTLFVPLPRLGITPDVVAAMDMSKSMSGVWVDEPWILLAFGAIYFAAQARAQYCFALDGRASRRTAQHSAR